MSALKQHDCGSLAAYMAHKRRGEPIDEQCKNARSKYDRRKYLSRTRWVFAFWCFRHERNLGGEPIFFDQEDDTFAIDLSYMECPFYVESNDCQNHWAARRVVI